MGLIGCDETRGDPPDTDGGAVVGADAAPAPTVDAGPGDGDGGPTPSDGGVSTRPDAGPPPSTMPLRERWVAPDGDDAAAGTRDAPWRTLSHAAAEAQPGDWIYVAPGTYAPVELSVSGTATDPIRLLAEDGAQVEANDAPAFTLSGSHLEVRGFSVRGTEGGFLVGDGLPVLNEVCADVDGYVASFPPDDRAEERGFIEGSCAIGAPRPATNHRVTGVVIDGVRSDGSRASIELSGDWSLGVQITDEARGVTIRRYEMTRMRHAVFVDGDESFRSVRDLTLEDLYVHDTTNYGARIVARQRHAFEDDPGGDLLHHVPDGSPRRGTVAPLPLRTQTIARLTMRGCRFERNAFTDPTTNEGYGNVLLQGISGGLVERNRFIDGAYWNIDALACNDFLYRNNVFATSDAVRDMTPRFNEWPSVNLEVNGGTGNRVYHNVFIGSEASIFESLFPEDFVVREVSVDIRNNLFVGALTSIERFPLSSWLASSEVEPNGVMEYVPVGGFTMNRRERDNLLDVGVNVLPDGTQFLDGDPEFFGEGNRVVPDLDPRFVDAAAGDYHLRADSPAVDTGADVAEVVPEDADGVTRPQGAGFDVGPYER